MNSKISIIIPVYGSEKYLSRCIESLLRQTHSNLEIIIVNDYSPNNTKKYIEPYKNDKRIVYLELQENKGGFTARVEGLKQATGNYIGFVDSDDYVTIDYYRSLLEKLLETDADIVCGKTIIENEQTGARYIHSRNEPYRNEMIGIETLYEFYKQAGETYYLQVIWNKLYKKELVDKAILHFENINKHLLMADDIFFVTVFYYYCKKYVKADCYGYYYVQHTNASTSSKSSFNKFKKNIEDVNYSFKLIKEFLEKKDVFENLEINYYKFKAKIFSEWEKFIFVSPLTKKEKEVLIDILKKSNDLSLGFLSPKHSFAYFTKDDYDSTNQTVLEKACLSSSKNIILDFNSIFKYEYISHNQVLMDLYNYAQDVLNVSIKENYEYLVEKLNNNYNLRMIYRQLRDITKIDKEAIELIKKKHEQLIVNNLKIHSFHSQLIKALVKYEKRISIFAQTVLDDKTIKDIISNHNVIDVENIIIGPINSGLEAINHYNNRNAIFVTENKTLVKNIKNQTEIQVLVPKCYNNSFYAEHYQYKNKVYIQPRTPLLCGINDMIEHKYRERQTYKIIHESSSVYKGDPYFLGYSLFGPIVLYTLSKMKRICIKKSIKNIWVSPYNMFSDAFKTYFDNYNILVEKQEPVEYKELINNFIDDVNKIKLIPYYLDLRSLSAQNVIENLLKIKMNQQQISYIESKGLIYTRKLGSSVAVEILLDTIVKMQIEIKKENKVNENNSNLMIFCDELPDIKQRVHSKKITYFSFFPLDNPNQLTLSSFYFKYNFASEILDFFFVKPKEISWADKFIFDNLAIGVTNFVEEALQNNRIAMNINKNQFAIEGELLKPLNSFLFNTTQKDNDLFITTYLKNGQSMVSQWNQYRTVNQRQQNENNKEIRKIDEKRKIVKVLYFIIFERDVLVKKIRDKIGR